MRLSDALTVSDFCRIYGLCRRNVNYRIARGTGPKVTRVAGRVPLIQRKHADAWVAANPHLVSEDRKVGASASNMYEEQQA
jgi:hypothetical protein